MSFVKIWIHAVWSTKNRQDFLIKEIRNTIFPHIHSNGLKKGILIDIIYGYSDHVHRLFRLRNDRTIQRTIQLLKGESFYWINQEKLTREKFSWQSEYFAISVSESLVEVVRNYIRKQEEHHKKKSFQQEYDEFITKYNFEV